MYLYNTTCIKLRTMTACLGDTTRRTDVKDGVSAENETPMPLPFHMHHYQKFRELTTEAISLLSSFSYHALLPSRVYTQEQPNIAAAANLGSSPTQPHLPYPSNSPKASQREN